MSQKLAWKYQEFGHSTVQKHWNINWDTIKQGLGSIKRGINTLSQKRMTLPLPSSTGQTALNHFLVFFSPKSLACLTMLIFKGVVCVCVWRKKPLLGDIEREKTRGGGGNWRRTKLRGGRRNYLEHPWNHAQMWWIKVLVHVWFWEPNETNMLS